MILGRVIGEIYGTIKHPFYDGRRLLVVAKLAHDGSATEDYLIAVDSVGSGSGETVVVLDEGNGARQVLDSPDGPVRSVIVGIIDDIV